ncbi:MAG TPA: HAD-IIB family hydrolase [Acetobacteraceae bacterium]|nr:HAD-IIB family hydrolase [Acetobacteraceae bacterium]
MHYVILATDYDGTIAHDGVVNETTLQALHRLRDTAHRVVLVTGRELDDLQSAMPELGVFDIIVSENGAVLYFPDRKEERRLAASPDPNFVARLRELRMDPLSVGRSIVATWEPNETKVLQAIRELGLELSITFNKGAVMVLPAGITKASGLRAALEALELSSRNCVAVGDAENDMAFLEVAGAPVAVANAVPALKERAVWVTDNPRGEGVVELIERLLRTDFAELDAGIERQCVALAQHGDGEPYLVAPHRETLLLTGVSGGGKSTMTQGLIERLYSGGFQFCIVDPEGDYNGLEGAVTIGTSEDAPTVEQAAKLLGRPNTSVVLNLLAMDPRDRTVFWTSILSALSALRASAGRPHFVIVDEAHHMLPGDWDPEPVALQAGLNGFLFITTRPEAVSPHVLQATDRLLVVGGEPQSVLDAFCKARHLGSKVAPATLPLGDILMLDVATETMQQLQVIPGEGTRLRHRRKYAEGRLGDDKSFWFRGADSRLRLQAHNLMLFIQIGEGVDSETWQWHRVQGDYSRWIREAIKDDQLSDTVAGIEASHAVPDEARRLIHEAIQRRYTAPP